MLRVTVIDFLPVEEMSGDRGHTSDLIFIWIFIIAFIGFSSRET